MRGDFYICMIFHLHTNPGGGPYYYSHGTDEETASVRISNSLKIMQQVRGRAEIPTHRACAALEAIPSVLSVAMAPAPLHFAEEASVFLQPMGESKATGCCGRSCECPSTFLTRNFYFVHCHPHCVSREGALVAQVCCLWHLIKPYTHTSAHFSRFIFQFKMFKREMQQSCLQIAFKWKRERESRETNLASV